MLRISKLALRGVEAPPRRLRRKRSPRRCCERGALGALGGQLEFTRDVFAIWNYWVDVPPKANKTGRNVLSVVALEKGPRVSTGTKVGDVVF